MTKNVVLYAVANAVRSPLASFDASEKNIATKVAYHAGEKMRESAARGVAAPDFVLVSEHREADEGGKFVVKAEFQELDVLTAKPIGSKFGTLDEVFAPPAAAPAPTESAASRKSKELSR
jgi:hypothetical protein